MLLCDIQVWDIGCRIPFGEFWILLLYGENSLVLTEGGSLDSDRLCSLFGHQLQCGKECYVTICSSIYQEGSLLRDDRCYIYQAAGVLGRAIYCPDCRVSSCFCRESGEVTNRNTWSKGFCWCYNGSVYLCWGSGSACAGCRIYGISQERSRNWACCLVVIELCCPREIRL